MLGYVVLSLLCVGMFVFAIGALLLNHEEAPYRYNLSITDEHEI
jgi:hypothetical protein